ncbi:MAG: gamma-glutamyl-gamma-aminobutyrate hydrolase family protein [Rhizobiales bacterium]|nr:gamma-glutamyl-gamma-aminobutyrate hydrolase family protein [Hyphomicrobiales bacterium]
MMQPLVAVSTDVKQFENYTWHAAPRQYIEAAIDGAGVFPVLVPSFGDRLDLDSLLDRVDGVMLTGSKSNVHPLHYGREATEADGPYDPDRDATTLPLIRRALERGVPLLAICRGIQELNVALGGSLATEIQEREGIMDHRAPVSDDQDERFAIRQTVTIAPGSCLAGVFGAGDIMVNSVHRQAVDRLGGRLQVEAVAPDGTVEAVSVKDAPAFAVGVQWHPEYWVKADGNSRKIFAAFGDAVRDHARLRAPARQAAE